MNLHQPLSPVEASRSPALEVSPISGGHPPPSWTRPRRACSSVSEPCQLDGRGMTTTIDDPVPWTTKTEGRRPSDRYCFFATRRKM